MNGRRSARIAALATGLIALAAPAASAQLPGLAVPPLPVLDEPLAVPNVTCVRVRGQSCVPLPATAAAGGEVLAEATSAKRIRRGLGFPTARKVLGKRAKRKLAQSDRRFTQALGRPLTEPTGRARAAASAKLRRGFEARDTARNGTAQQARQMRMELQVDECPDPKSAEDANGISAVDGRATFRAAMISRHRRGWVLDTLNMIIDIRTRALVNRNADYAGLLPPGLLRMSRTRQRYDPRTGNSTPGYTGQAQFEIHGWEPPTVSPAPDFERFMDNSGRIDTVGPELTAPDEMQRTAYRTMAQRFVAWVSRQMVNVVEEAEGIWKTPNRCVKLDMEGPGRLSPSETTEVIGRLTPVGGVGAKEGLYGRYMTFGANFINGGTAETIANLPLELEEKWIRYTAPPDAWEDDARPGLDVTAYTKGGIGRAPITFELTPRDLAYKVLSATFSENMSGNADIPGSGCNLSGVPTDFQQGGNMSIGEQPLDPANRFRVAEDGSITGLILANGMGTSTGTMHGCDITVAPPWPPCTTPFSGEVLWGASFYVDIAAGSQTAVLTWPTPPLTSNIQNSEPGCLAGGFTGEDPNPLPKQEVPVETFYRTEPQTVEFGHSRSVAGGGRSISSTIHWKVTFRRLTPEELASLPGRR